MATALITGASSGLGAEFARQLGAQKFDLVLTARREDRLRAIGEHAVKAGAGKIQVIAADLSQRNAPRTIFEKLQTSGTTIDYLVNNAGFGTRGDFADLPLERELEEIDLNVSALVAMTHLFVPGMVARRRGTVINVASTAAFQPIPHMATYGATKAFVLNFSEAVAAELSGTGVTVTALCPGPTRTEFQEVAGVDDSGMPSFAFMTAEKVVAQAIAAARKGKSLRINGAFNLMLAESTRLAPRSLTARIAGSMFKNKSA